MRLRPGLGWLRAIAALSRVPPEVYYIPFSLPPLKRGTHKVALSQSRASKVLSSAHLRIPVATTPVEFLNESRPFRS